MDGSICTTCGSSGAGLICTHCGAALRRPTSVDEERAQIEALHHAIIEAPDDATRERMLKHGPVPDRGAPLVDAVVRVVGMLDTEDAYADLAEVTLERANTLLVRLRVLGELDPASQRAKAELERAVARYTKDRAGFDRVMLSVAGLGCLGLLGALVAWWLTRL